MDRKVNIGPRSTIKVVFLKSSIFISLIWNLKRSCIFGHCEFNQQLFLRSNLFYGFCEYPDLLEIIFLLFCCLFVCNSPTGHNIKPIFTKLHQAVEVVSAEKPIDFEVKGPRLTTRVVFLKSSIFIRLTWNLKKIYSSGHWFQLSNYF